MATRRPTVAHGGAGSGAQCASGPGRRTAGPGRRLGPAAGMEEAKRVGFDGDDSIDVDVCTNLKH